MAGFSDTIAGEILNYFLRGTAFTTFSAAGTPASVWLALFDGDPEGAGVELTYTGYARVAITRNAGAWDAPSGTGTVVTANAGAHTFGDPTAGGPQDATHFALMSAVTGGTVLLSDALTVPQVITDGGSPPTVAIGAIDVAIADA